MKKDQQNVILEGPSKTTQSRDQNHHHAPDPNAQHVSRLQGSGGLGSPSRMTGMGQVEIDVLITAVALGSRNRFEEQPASSSLSTSYRLGDYIHKMMRVGRVKVPTPAVRITFSHPSKNKLLVDENERWCTLCLKHPHHQFSRPPQRQYSHWNMCAGSREA